MKNLLHTSIEYLKGVGPARAEVLKSEYGIRTFEDLISYYPYKYIDKTKIYKISEIVDDSAYIQIKGKITGFDMVGHGRAKRLVANFSDGTSEVELVWFNSIKWMQESLKLGLEYLVFGKPTIFNRKFSFTHPEMEIYNQREANPIPFHPLYNTSEKSKKRGIDSKALSKLIYQMFLQVQSHIPENLSQEILEKNRLVSREYALFNKHFPKNVDEYRKANYRLKFEELFFNQLKLLKTRQIRIQNIKGHSFEKVGEAFQNFYHNNLPFELTDAQKRVIKEIRADMRGPTQMNRLLQGDVGSGKTIVALLVMLIAIDNDFQSCIMAPTEVLAQQHFYTISKLLGDDSEIKVELLTGSTKAAQKRKIKEQLQSGELKIVVGTHALLEDDVIFENLGLTIIDEQHRFGVAQRAKLWMKNTPPPHVLVMTATPIPRTLAMTLFGDLSVSVIDELPKNRKPIKTVHFFDNNRLKIQGLMKNEIEKGRQIYVVFPLIEESQTIDLKHLEEGFDALSRDFPLPKYAIGQVHGRMKPEEKEYEMNRFKKGETDILVSTTVIEVGVDVPNASVMVIEDAQRFGLLQLHQLRGRVGRGAEQSYCVLVTNYELSKEGKERIAAMVKTNDGFEIANLDLKIRGPGDIEGTRQSGLLDLKVADISKDEQILLLARNYAQDLLEQDPEIEKVENIRIKEFLNEILVKSKDWSLIS
ncbi:MAG: ATP-dependent DNA helicase RecG [Bacteroidales bacterium]|jgi:ATP-dependent DNA helicase RecG|nr:ATP-dependent DNA helicase RecG [Bacteroidales bacterium]